MTDDELKMIVATNAQAIERNAQAIERNAQAIERNAQAIERSDSRLSIAESRAVSIQQQLELLTRQVQSMISAQNSNTDRSVSNERSLQGIYDVLLTNAREQAERSKLIDQQIQSLIDERRRS